MKNGLENIAIADVTFIATSTEDGETQKGKSNSDGTIQLGPFAGRDIVNVKVKKEKFDSWNEDINMATLQSQVQVTLNPTVCFWVFEF